MPDPAPDRPGDEDDDDDSASSEDDNPQDGEVKKDGKPKKKKGMKSPEALEREKQRNDNYEKYAHLSDENLEKIVPRKADGSVTSIGAMLHESETCSPCNFVHMANGCTNTVRCKFCHADHPKRQRTRGRKRKRAALAAAAAGEAGEGAAENGKPVAKALRKNADGEENRQDGLVPVDERGNSWPCFYEEDDDTYGYMGRRASAYARQWSYSAQATYGAYGGAGAYGGVYGAYFSAAPPPHYPAFAPS